MNVTRTVFDDLPPLTLTSKELTDILISFFVENPSSYYFTSFVGAVANKLKRDRIGFKAEPNTVYEGGLNQRDVATIREIIWDMIIARHLTIGGNGHDEWPNFTVTERGKAYFSAMQQRDI